MQDSSLQSVNSKDLSSAQKALPRERRKKEIVDTYLHSLALLETQAEENKQAGIKLGFIFHEEATRVNTNKEITYAQMLVINKEIEEIEKIELAQRLAAQNKLNTFQAIEEIIENILEQAAIPSPNLNILEKLEINLREILIVFQENLQGLETEKNVLKQKIHAQHKEITPIKDIALISLEGMLDKIFFFYHVKLQEIEIRLNTFKQEMNPPNKWLPIRSIDELEAGIAQYKKESKEKKSFHTQKMIFHSEEKTLEALETRLTELSFHYGLKFLEVEKYNNNRKQFSTEENILESGSELKILIEEIKNWQQKLEAIQAWLQNITSKKQKLDEIQGHKSEACEKLKTALIHRIKIDGNKETLIQEYEQKKNDELHKLKVFFYRMVEIDQIKNALIKNYTTENNMLLKNFQEGHKTYLREREHYLDQETGQLIEWRKLSTEAQNNVLEKYDTVIRQTLEHKKNEFNALIQNCSSWKEVETYLKSLTNDYELLDNQSVKLLEQQTKTIEQIHDQHRTFKEEMQIISENYAKKFNQWYLCLSEYCENGNLDEIKEWIQSSPESINECDTEGLLPLHIACCSGKQAVVEYLLSQGASRTKLDESEGLTAYHYACMQSNPEILEALLSFKHETSKNKLKYNISGLINKSYVTLLHTAVDYSQQDMIMWLIKNTNIDIDAQDSEGNTALHWAAREGNEKIINCLIERGANIHVKNNNNERAIYLSALHDSHEKVSIFMKYGYCLIQDEIKLLKSQNTFFDHDLNKNLENYINNYRNHLNPWEQQFFKPFDNELKNISLEDSQDIENSSDLLLSIRFRVLQSVVQKEKTLIGYCAKNELENVKDIVTRLPQTVNEAHVPAGFLPLHVACLFGNEEIVDYLLKKCADRNQKDSTPEQLTAVHYACMQPDTKILEKLFFAKISILKKSMSIRSRENNTVIYSYLRTAIIYYQLPVIIWLFENCDIDVTYEKKIHSETILHLAAKLGTLGIIAYLISRSMNVNALNEEDHRPIMTAALHHKDRVISVFMNYGYCLNQQEIQNLYLQETDISECEYSAIRAEYGNCLDKSMESYKKGFLNFSKLFPQLPSAENIKKTPFSLNRSHIRRNSSPEKSMNNNIKRSKSPVLFEKDLSSSHKETSKPLTLPEKPNKLSYFFLSPINSPALTKKKPKPGKSESKEERGFSPTN